MRSKDAVFVKLHVLSSAYHSTVAMQAILLWQAVRTIANAGQGTSQQSAVRQRKLTSSLHLPMPSAFQPARTTVISAYCIMALPGSNVAEVSIQSYLRSASAMLRRISACKNNGNFCILRYRAAPLRKTAYSRTCVPCC